MSVEYPRGYLYRRIVRAKMYIDANYSSDIDLDNIAGEAHFSKYHFIRLFRKAYGRTPHRYLIFVRVQQARRMLEEQNSIQETCYAVGFESIASFTTLFRRYTGYTPAVYRESVRRKKEESSSTPLRFIPGCFAGKTSAE